MNTTEDNKTNKMDIPPVVPGKRKVKRVQNNFLKQLLICLAIVFAFLIFTHVNDIKNSVYNLTHGKTSSTSEPTFHFGARRQNILLMGVDVSENKDEPFENTRSDSIYLISVAPHAKNVNVISIPRDSKVYIHSKATPDKINHAFVFAIDYYDNL